MTKKESGGMIKVLLLITCILLLGAGIAMIFIGRAVRETAISTPQNQTQAQIEAERLFERTVYADLAAYYPESPSAVMDFYNNTVRLLYSGGITDETMLKQILAKQRELYAPSLLELNDFDSQFVNLMASLNSPALRRIAVSHVETVNTFNDPADDNLVVVSTVIRLTGDDDLYFNYYLALSDDDRWQIVLRESTDASFRRMADVPHAIGII